MKKNLSALFFVFFLSTIMFTLKSDIKDDNPLTAPPPVICENLPKLDGQLTISFDVFAPNPYRNPIGFANYVPLNDIRSANCSSYPPAANQQVDGWFMLVTITSPSCPKFIWTRVIDQSTCSNYRIMPVKLPPNQYDCTLKVEYWEDSDYQNQDFNIPISSMFGTFQHSRVKWGYQKTYQNFSSGNANIALTPVDHIGYLPANHVLQPGDPFYGITSGTKAPLPMDGSLNYWIDLNIKP